MSSPATPTVAERPTLRRTGAAEIVVVGAGPAGLAVATALHCYGSPGFEVLDPSGGWLDTWHRRLAAQDVRHLRSPATHHPHPDPFALLNSVEDDDLVRRDQASLPTVPAFDRFTMRLIGELGLDQTVTAATVTALELRPDGRPELTCTDGRTRSPQRVILATDRRVPRVPSGLGGVTAHPRVHLGADIDLVRTPAGGHVLVIGGGLSAAHLAAGAVARGARVTLVARRPLRVRPYDTEVVWMGQWKLRSFEDEPDPAVRRRAIDDARGGGSMPRRFHDTLQAHHRSGELDLRTDTTVLGVEVVGDHLEVALSDHTVVACDAIWSATGARVDIRSDPLLTHLIDHRPTPIVGGLPVLDAALRWPGTPVHLAGAAAGLVLGPAAGNLFGHRRAAQRIATFLGEGAPAHPERHPAWTDVIRAAGTN